MSSDSTNGIIHVLPENVANKIAAGEVVQRPASVVKELIENSIDAGADRIKVIIKKAGRELVQVVDNGSGMSPSDARAAFQRHATSKIASVEDLERIHTLGFRGEALASIGSVAQVELRTRRHEDESGFLVEMNGGDLDDERPCATPPGTSVAVRNLFYNVPARRNFLKTPATEFKHIVETFQFLALANPDTEFVLIHNDNEVHRLPQRRDEGMDDLRGRIVDLFGENHTDDLIPVAEETTYLSINGFVGKPNFSRKSRDKQFLFINDRYVESRYLSHAVASGYGDMLPKGSFPFFSLFLDLDPRHVDVNVHPTKKEVKLEDERGVYGFVRAVVKKALGSADITPDMGYDEEGQLVEQSGIIGVRGDSPGDSGGGDGASGRRSPQKDHQDSHSEGGIFQEDLGHLTDRFYRGPQSEDEDTSSTDRRIGVTVRQTEDDGREASQSKELSGERTSARSTSDQRLIWQLHEKYVLTRIQSGLMIMDQHAAHERILYEKALETMKSGVGMAQQLLFPQTLEFDASDYGLVEELLPDLRGLGFDIETLSGRSVIVRGVPAEIRIGDERTILEEILEQYKSYRDELKIEGRENLAKSVACKSAIKAGEELSTAEMRSLIDQLFGCDMPYSCPHGRPTMIKVSLDELDKRFGRTEHVDRAGTVH